MLVLGNSFWDKVHGVVGILEPIYVVLRMVDNETNLLMGSYPSIQLMKEAIMVKAPNAYKWVDAIIDDRWERTLSHPLHQAAYFLNPKYHYSQNHFEDNSLKTAVHEVYDHLFPSCPGKGTFGSEVNMFRNYILLIFISIIKYLFWLVYAINRLLNSATRLECLSVTLR
ncbi:uncharacterized protein LOC131251178 isoform X1 [Magnolia sinica]|uniref:uncharacterized protein LOC131251178 isoform X1 n=1 Tax=Magnolia sinica TaxID=86752 RepID=UPI002657C045|nr:uncharacterized protein LOC131251178 isoform X1 [Magnolia sinica]